jgi:hypothetical protein
MLVEGIFIYKLIVNLILKFYYKLILIIFLLIYIILKGYQIGYVIF